MNYIEYRSGDIVVVIDHDPDPDYRDKEIPIGTIGVFRRRQGECNNPATNETDQYGEVLFDCDPANHPWCSPEEGKTLASVFYSMIAPVCEEKYDCPSLDGFFS